MCATCRNFTNDFNYFKQLNVWMIMDIDHFNCFYPFLIEEQKIMIRLATHYQPILWNEERKRQFENFLNDFKYIYRIFHQDDYGMLMEIQYSNFEE